MSGDKARQTASARYWDEALEELQLGPSLALWRAHCDAVNEAWLKLRLPAERTLRLLKTDLFDDALGEGLFPLLTQVGQRRISIAIDVSRLTIREARRRHPGLSGIQADVRQLPFVNDTFGLIVSNSTLDHFSTQNDLFLGLKELYRVLEPGGTLFLTLDNLANPIIALRQILPFSLLHRLGLVPYFVGKTLGPARLQGALESVGFTVMDVEALLHCPRVLAIPLAKKMHQYGHGSSQRRFLRLLKILEGLERWPTRFITGHFVAARAVKRSTEKKRENID